MVGSDKYSCAKRNQIMKDLKASFEEITVQQLETMFNYYSLQFGSPQVLNLRYDLRLHRGRRTVN